MRTLLLVAAAFAVVLSASAAFAEDADTNSPQDNISVITFPDTTFDLGVNVSGVPHTQADVDEYLATLPAVTRSAVVNSCETYMEHPVSAQEPETLAFCSIAVGG